MKFRLSTRVRAGIALLLVGWWALPLNMLHELVVELVDRVDDWVYERHQEEDDDQEDDADD